MLKRLYTTLFACFVMAVTLLSGCSRKEEEKPSFRFATRWMVTSSFKYDLACFIGIMAGRDFHTRYYPDLYADWKKRLTPPATLALKQINEIFGPETPPGPQLCLLFSAIPDSADSLGAIMSFLDKTSALPSALTATDHTNGISDQQWQALRPHLRILLEFLEKQGFPNYWKSHLFPSISKQIPYARRELQAFDVIGDLERFLVDADYPDTISVYVVRLVKPHALRLSGQRYITETTYPTHVTVKSAYHEILHRYAHRVVDSVLTADFERLHDDSFLQLTAARIDQNTTARNFRAFFNEEITIAAEVWLAERRRMISQIMRASGADASTSVRRYLAELDEGRHVFAAVIYSLLAEGMKNENQPYAQFLAAQFRSGRLAPGKIEERYNKFMNQQ